MSGRLSTIPQKCTKPLAPSSKIPIPYPVPARHRVHRPPRHCPRPLLILCGMTQNLAQPMSENMQPAEFIYPHIPSLPKTPPDTFGAWEKLDILSVEACPSCPRPLCSSHDVRERVGWEWWWNVGRDGRDVVVRQSPMLLEQLLTTAGVRRIGEPSHRRAVSRPFPPIPRTSPYPKVATPPSGYPILLHPIIPINLSHSSLFASSRRASASRAARAPAGS